MTTISYLSYKNWNKLEDKFSLATDNKSVYSNTKIVTQLKQRLMVTMWMLASMSEPSAS